MNIGAYVFCKRLGIMSVLALLQQKKTLLCDGATGTMLMAQGLKTGECPELWNLHQPQILTNLTQRYLIAGADIVQTNTFGASFLKLTAYGLESQIKDINYGGVLAVQKAVQGKALIAGSIGPSGKLIKPYGDTEPQAVYESFAAQMSALVQAGVDLFCMETMSDIEEAVLAIQAARHSCASIPIMATMTFQHGKRGFFTTMGNNIRTCCERLQLAGADIIGSNCGNGTAAMIQIANEFKKYTLLPLIMQPNAGLPQVQGQTLVYPETPEYMATHAQEFLKIGVGIIGGCCGTTPEHIQALRKTIG